MPGSPRNILSRRHFLRLSGAVALGGLLPWPFPAGRQCQAATARPDNHYYVVHRQELLQAFAATNEGARQYLAARFGAGTARDVTRQAAFNFQELLPRLPDVGGEKNLDVQYLPIAAWYLAYYPPMRSHGQTAEDVGRMLYDLNAQELEQIPKDHALAEGMRLFSPSSLERLARWAAWTQKREHPANWVASFIPGDRRDFDFGYDYTECALVKFFRAHQASELAPYVCLNDFLKSRTYGTGLRRTQTLAQGDPRCDFRYRQGRPVTQDWDTEIPKIRARLGST